MNSIIKKINKNRNEIDKLLDESINVELNDRQLQKLLFTYLISLKKDFQELRQYILEKEKQLDKLIELINLYDKTRDYTTKKEEKQNLRSNSSSIVRNKGFGTRINDAWDSPDKRKKWGSRPGPI